MLGIGHAMAGEEGCTLLILEHRQLAKFIESYPDIQTSTLHTILNTDIVRHLKRTPFFETLDLVRSLSFLSALIPMEFPIIFFLIFFYLIFLFLEDQWSLRNFL